MKNVTPMITSSGERYDIPDDQRDEAYSARTEQDAGGSPEERSEEPQASRRIHCIEDATEHC